MTTMTIQGPGKAKTKLSAIVKEMGGEIISISTDKQAAKKARLLNQIKQGLEEVKKIQEGKAKSYSMSDLLDDK
jgi:glutamate dehydrogenase/leucine dehydrogenase